MVQRVGDFAKILLFYADTEDQGKGCAGGGGVWIVTNLEFARMACYHPENHPEPCSP